MSIPLATASCFTRRGKLHIRNRAAFDSVVATLPDGLELELELTRLRATRSQQQNAGYWGVIVQALSEHTGYTPEEVHDILKAKFLPKRLAILKGNGDVVDEFVMGGSTRGLSTVEFGEYMEQIKMWAASELEVYIPDFDDRGYGAGV